MYTKTARDAGGKWIANTCKTVGAGTAVTVIGAGTTTCTTCSVGAAATALATAAAPVVVPVAIGAAIFYGISKIFE